MNLYNSKNLAGSSLIKIIKFDSLARGAPLCVITKKEAGSMGSNIAPDYKNRNRIMDILGIDKIVCLKQEHTDIVYESREIDFLLCRDEYPVIPALRTGDGIITSEKKVLTVTVADCLPIFLYDSKTSAYGIVHSGWKGTGIVLNAIDKMQSCYGTKSEDIHVIIGPSIGKCCYSVDRERASGFASKWGSETVIVTEDADGSEGDCTKKMSSFFLDLKKANKIMLEKAGVKNIAIDENCTCCSEEFHSYRRDKPEGFGQMLAFIGYF
ncbi:MAG: peptidoglycan editing factor PgeF [Spirochaetes bacterium]|nr:peptidoglycan editing factor PgeF [Spirochaetota bacterium]